MNGCIIRLLNLPMLQDKIICSLESKAQRTGLVWMYNTFRKINIFYFLGEVKNSATFESSIFRKTCDSSEDAVSN